jgi:stress responsive alpha/beta barrel protein
VIAHVVLLQPRASLSTAERKQALASLTRAASEMSEIRRFRIGRRVRHGLPGYEQAMAQDFEFALIVEFDDVEGLKRYLRAPAHAALGGLFTTATDAALAYDYEIVEPADAVRLL